MADSQLDRHAERALELVEATLADREKRIVSAVTAKLAAGDEITGQYAIQQWLALGAVSQLRKALLTKAKMQE